MRAVAVGSRNPTRRIDGTEHVDGHGWEARNNGARLPVTALVDQFYAGIQAKDGNRWDTSSLLRNLTQD